MRWECGGVLGLVMGTAAQTALPFLRGPQAPFRVEPVAASGADEDPAPRSDLQQWRLAPRCIIARVPQLRDADRSDSDAGP